MRPDLPALVAPAFAIAGYHGVVVFLILLASAGSALAWRLTWRGDPACRRGMVWLGGRDALGQRDLSQLHGVSRRPWRRHRADGRLGTAADRERKRETGDERIGPWWLHGAALALLPWIHTRFALIAGSLGALIILRLSTTRNCGRKGGRVPDDPHHQRDLLDRVLHRDLWHARPVRSLRERGRLGVVYPGRNDGTVFRSALRPAGVCAGARGRVLSGSARC